jgi:DNA excision repair protein ERCC-2
MSATLEPIEFFRDVLGFPPERTRAASFPSPFPRENRRVLIDPGFATTFRRRSKEAERIARTVEAIAALRRGNYLVFLSSHGYLEEVAACIDPRRLGNDVLAQPRGAGEEERDRILALLREPGSARILLAVQGGIFAEGVDYPGEMAVGVIVVGPGLPRYDYETELIRDHFENRCQMGFEHAYLYPGMHRVIQAAGRLIRGPEDEGVVVLLGERFADSRYARLLPADWYRSSPGELVTADPSSATSGSSGRGGNPP